MVFKTGLLSDPGAADIGWAHVPLGELHDRLARKALDSAGVRTEVRTRVTSISTDENGRWSVQVPGETLEPTRSSSPYRSARPTICCRTGALDAPERLLEIGTAPILNVHVVYDRKVLDRPFFAALGTPVQWVFDRTDASGLRERPVPRAVPVGRARRDRRTRGRAARALPARAGAAAARARAAPR